MRTKCKETVQLEAFEDNKVCIFHDSHWTYKISTLFIYFLLIFLLIIIILYKKIVYLESRRAKIGGANTV